MKSITFLFLTLFLLFAAQLSWSQILSVSGRILDETSGIGIRSVSVFEAKQGIGTISNSEGYYKLLIKPGEKTLKVTCSGFHDFSESFHLMRDTTLTVMLKPEKPERAKAEEILSLEDKKEHAKAISVQRMVNNKQEMKIP